MTYSSSTSTSVLAKQQQSGMQIVTLRRGKLTERFITATPLEGEGPEAALARVASVLKETKSSVVVQDIFGSGGFDHPTASPDAASVARCPFMKETFGDISWPVTWVREERGEGTAFRGTQVWAISGAEVKPVEVAGRVVGRFFEDDAAQYCRLGGLTPASVSVSDYDQTGQVFEAMMSGLKSVGMDFSNVIRTWFYNREILSWYRDFNKARDVFFRANNVFNGLVPASTGMGGANPAGAALTTGLIAIKAKASGVKTAAVRSPLQNPALDYGSSFSRAVELETPGLRRVLVSGTASIGEDGKTQYLGDMDAQVARTMEVVRAILNSCDMDWEDVTRAVAYYKEPQDDGAFSRYCESAGVPALPVVFVNNDVCRDDLMFEIELDAISCS